MKKSSAGESVIELRALIFDEQENYPKYGHECERILLIMNASVGTAKSIKYRSILFIDPVGYLEAVCFVFEPIGSVTPVLCPFG